VAPDGRSLITSIFTQQNAVWIHDSRGERALSTDGYADLAPLIFSSDGRRLYYLLRRNSPESASELWRADLDSGNAEVVLPEVSMREYDISIDEKEVVFSTQPAGEPSQLWLAPLDRSAPPRRIAASGDADPHFGPDGQVLFRLTDGKAYYLGAMTRDGTGRRKALPDTIFDIVTVSPDRRFIIVGASLPGSRDPKDAPTIALPLNGGPSRRICESWCSVKWSPDGRYFYVGISPASRHYSAGKLVAIPVPRGASLPWLPPEGFRRSEESLRLPGIQIVDQAEIAPGLNPSTYAYVKPAVHANLFRIPLQ
jgi:eukaryotic-like serine/threonine-protein kinase